MSESKNLVVVNNKPQLPMVVEDTSLYSYLEQIKRFPVLSEEEEKKLINDFQTNGDLASAQKLITSHLRLAAKIALTYRRYGLPMADVISEANLPKESIEYFSANQSDRLGKMIHDVVINSIDKPEVKMSEEGWHHVTKLREWMFEHVYLDPITKSEETKARNIIKSLFEYYSEKLSLAKQNFTSRKI